MEEPIIKLEHVLNLKCLVCGKQYQPGEVEYVCPDHGDEGVLDVQYDYDLIGRQIDRDGLSYSRDFTIWRYKPLLSVHRHTGVSPRRRVDPLVRCFPYGIPAGAEDLVDQG